MDERPKIAVSRKVGGWGDQICALVALRAAVEKYGADYDVISGVGSPFFSFIAPSAIAEGAKDCISPSYERWDQAFTPDKYAYWFDLDGPEMRHAVSRDWDITESRIETWCRAVDYMPSDTTPHIVVPKDSMRVAASNLEASGLQPNSYIVFQWRSRVGFKDMPQRAEVVADLISRGHRVFIIDGSGDDIDSEMQRYGDLKYWSAYAIEFQLIAAYCKMASLVIAPDSALMHLAGGVGTPCVAIWGSTNADITMKHYPLSTYIWGRDVSGKPCEGSFPCWGRDERYFWCKSRIVGKLHQVPWCIEQIPVAKIVDLAEQHLERHKAYNIKRANSLDYAGSGTWSLAPDGLATDLLQEESMRMPFKRSIRTSSGIVRSRGIRT